MEVDTAGFLECPLRDGDRRTLDTEQLTPRYSWVSPKVSPIDIVSWVCRSHREHR